MRAALYCPDCQGLVYVEYVEKDDHLVYVKAEGLCFGCRKTLCKNRSELVYSCTSYQPRVTRGSR